MPRAGWNSLPRPARSASNPEVEAGLLRMALPFVGCREASSSLVYFAAQSAKNKEKPPFGRSFSDCQKSLSLRASARREASALGVLLGMTGVGFIDTLPPSDRMGYSFWNAAGRVELAASTGAQRGEPFRRGRRPRRPVSAAPPRWERIPTPLRAAKQVPLGYSSE